jgi:hypothetical protein
MVVFTTICHVRWAPVTTAWHVLRLQMEKQTPAMEISCECGRSSKLEVVTKNKIQPRTWMDSLDKRPKQQNMDMRFGL